MPETAPPRTVLNLRRDLRVAGPFDGQWVGALTVPLRIHDLSVGGCLIQAYHEQAPGRRFTLEIDLPDEGWIEIEAESIYVREGFGFAARFVNVDDETREILTGFIRRQRRLEKTRKSPSL
jgi:hypothetical protein